MRCSKLTIWLLSALFAAAHCINTAVAADVSPGLAVGQAAPAFSLADQSGQDVSLEALLKAGPVALVFHRSADW